MKSWILVFSFCIVLSSGFAQFAGGSGTESDPWQVATARQLDKVRNYLGEVHEDKHFIQTADIDLCVHPWDLREGWVPIGLAYYGSYIERDSYPNDYKFFGHYNGNGKVISNLLIDRPFYNFQGLFRLSAGQIQNLGLVNVHVCGEEYTGSLVGENSGTISNCYSVCSVTGNESIGGLVGWNYGIIDNCYSSYRVWGNIDTGGLVGHNSGTINNCYSSGNASGGAKTGGLVGYNSGTVSNCYSIGSVIGEDYTGGLVGSNNGTISNCYCTGSVSGEHNTGGLVGYYYDTIDNCYWDTQTSGQISSAGGKGRTTREMIFPHAANIYNKWDWRIWKPDVNHSVNNGYPYFRPTVEMATQLPEVAVNLIPADQSVSIPLDFMLQWQTGFSTKNADPPSGFKLWLGTDNPPSNIINELDLGYVNEFATFRYLSENCRYYWRIVPYNQMGDALDVPVWSFQTYTTTGFAGGSGTEQDPWQVANAEHLYNVRYYVGLLHRHKHFIQTADIDLGVSPWNQGEGWVPIAEENYRFYGHYDGNGYVISNLFINRPYSSYQSLFGSSSGQIQNLGVEDAYVNGGNSSGALVGQNSGIISNCYCNGSVSGKDYTGGLVGSNDGTISNCYCTGSVSGEYSIGGLVGRNPGTINNCYSSGSVSGKDCTGGLVGTDREYIETYVNTKNCYWDKQTSKQSFSFGGVGRTTREMVYPHESNPYKGWDFRNVWAEDSSAKINSGYPILKFQLSRKQNSVKKPGSADR